MMITNYYSICNCGNYSEIVVEKINGDIYTYRNCIKSYDRIRGGQPLIDIEKHKLLFDDNHDYLVLHYDNGDTMVFHYSRVKKISVKI